jgi:glycosyltransferase involved in cell wall biosynthesis
MREHRALWVSTREHGGIWSYIRVMQNTPLWIDWNIRLIGTHRPGSSVVKVRAFARGVVEYLVELLRSRPDVVHLHAASGSSFVRKATLLWLAVPMRVPVVLHMHGSRIQGFYETSPRVVRAFIRATLGRAAAVVALGEVWATRLGEIAPGARIVVIPNAVPPAKRVSQPAVGESVSVVFLGSIGEHKGAFRLLDAWAEVSRGCALGTGPRKAATLTIAGNGDVERARERIRELQIDDTVEICDWLSENKVGELLDHAHVLVLPSLNEGQPMAVLEAMARGICVIASDVGGLPEMIGDGCGVIVPPQDVAAIAAAVQHSIEDHEMRTRLGAAAYARAADRYDVRVVWRTLEALYREVSR